MPKELYYTVKHEIEDCFTTGNKSICLYEIVDNRPKLLTEIQADTSDSSVDLMYDYMCENDTENNEYTFTLL